VALYDRAASYAETCGLILADTKFEFGRCGDEILLADEVLTPDSSRFWEASAWKPGGAQPSFDKQFVRDYLEEIHWNKQAPAPGLPEDVVERTQAKYLEAFRRLTGRELSL
jgi:phosphoribosylaminoimidazole-succinocarboxamide synthase